MTNENPKPPRVQIDRDFCQTHGVCTREAPEVFRLDGDTS